MRQLRRIFRHESNEQRVEREIDDELAFHFERTMEELRAAGLSKDDAQREAIRRFGNVDLTRERLRMLDIGRVRVRRRAAFVDMMRQQLRFSLRGLSKQPVLSVSIVATFALGVGANAAMFSLLDRLLLRAPAGVVDPHGLFRVNYRHLDLGGQPSVSAGLFHLELPFIRQALGAGSRVGAYDESSGWLIGGERSGPRVDVARVTDGFFEALGVRPSIGRLFSPEELDPRGGVRMVAVLSDDVWHRMFHADTSVLGKQLVLSRQPYTIIGVTPRGFTGIDISAVGVWLPAPVFELSVRRKEWYRETGYATWRTIVRAPHGMDTRELAQRLTLGHRRALESVNEPIESQLTMLPSALLEARGPGEPRHGVSVAYRLSGVALLLLLIACANITNLMLARAVQRRREIAIRLALGVSRARLLSQLLMEGILLALCGAAAAIVVAFWGGTVLRSMLLPDTHWVDSPVTARVVSFATIVAVLTGIGTALVPAVRARRSDILASLRGGAQTGAMVPSRLRGALIAIQACLSVVLLVGTGLFARSLQRASAIDTGFDIDRLISADLPSAVQDTSRADMPARLRVLADRLARLPGVERVAFANVAPMHGYSLAPLEILGLDSIPTPASGPPTRVTVAPGYFETVGLRIARGRAFSDADRADAPRTAIVNEYMARLAWPNQDPIGKCILVGTDRACATVVGVAENSRRMKLVEEPTMQYFLPLEQYKQRPGVLLVRASPAVQGALASTLQREVMALDPEGDGWVERESETIGRALKPWRVSTLLFGLCAALALLVASVGVYSTMAYHVHQRTHEFGVRIALGARARDILGHVMRTGMLPVSIGVVLGIALSVAGSRFIAALLYDTSTLDPLVLGVVATLLMAAGVAACVSPSLRAVRVDPLDVLRSE